ncbi:MAG: nitroreductase family protein [Atopobiaceae bacterium]|jgi:predicted oxidoreductase (fatty acid repression mutant protein)
MSVIESLENRRSIYALNKDLPVAEDEVVASIKRIAELVPDAFNMHSQRVVIALGDKQDQLWNAIYDAFGGKVAREKIDGFKAAAGTVLYFTDQDVVAGLQEQFATYAANFPIWAQQSNGMLQLSIWTGLRDMGIGANIQHYNPVIDEAVHKLFNVPESWTLLAEMPFGGIVSPAGEKAGENIDDRVKVFK